MLKVRARGLIYRYWWFWALLIIAGVAAWTLWVVNRMVVIELGPQNFIMC